MMLCKGNMRTIVYLAIDLLLVLSSSPPGQAGNYKFGMLSAFARHQCLALGPSVTCSEEKCPLICDVHNHKRDGAYCNKTVTPWQCCCPHKFHKCC
ncbi:hypothetical protein BS78_05G019900 [Paspalum vaginatum]|nr:hypothetical protein BS78_05G019900 [Paspalum vaginatum]